MGVRRAFGATLFVCLWAAFSGATGALAAGPFMTIGTETGQPRGYRQFCQDYPQECLPVTQVSLADPVAPVKLTPALILAVATTNTAVNSTIKPMSDWDLYGVEERWTYPLDDKGDCEDYALLKRRMLHERAGIALGNLLMTVVRKMNGEGHAVLTLRSDRGDFILDNLDWRVRPFGVVPYHFLKRQSSADPNVWDRIEDGSEPVVAAVAK